MRAHDRALAEAGGHVVFVGTGTPAMASAFAAAHAGSLPVFVDARRAAFVAAGMRRGLRSLLSPRLLANAVRAWRRGFRQGRVQGDAWQLGGVVVVDADANYRLIQRDAVGGDELDFAAVVAALRAIRGA